MKHRSLAGLVASGVALLLTLGFACVNADIPNVSNDLRDALAENYANAGAPPAAAAGRGGSASTPNAGAGGDGGSAGGEDEPEDPESDGGAAGSSMAGVAGGDGVGEGSAGGPPVTGGGCDGFAVLEMYCATSGCHGDPGAPLGDFASSEEAAREFIGQGGRLSCAGQGSIIDTEDPSASILVAKMSSDPPCGAQMPPTGEALSDEEVACVEEWISGL